MNRKKISLKGVLLALAVSVPPLISTAVFTAPTQQSIIQTHGLVDQGKTFTSLSEPSNNVNQNLLIDNYDLTQAVPAKASLAQIQPFKWINYRTRSEIETQIHDLIVKNTKQELVEQNKDYEIIFAINVETNRVVPNPIVPIQTVKVKAMANSDYLTGEFSFEIIEPLTIPVDNYDHYSYYEVSASSDQRLKESLALDIELFMKWTENINEDSQEVHDQLLAALNIIPGNLSTGTGSKYWPRLHDWKSYYREVVFQLLPNKFVKSGLITWHNVGQPVYSNDEIPQVFVNWDYSLSYVDSTSDRDYPHADDSNVYINSNHDPKRKEIQYSPTITFAEFDIKEMFDLSSPISFFSRYNLNFDYDYKLNTWTSNWGWSEADGKLTATTFAHSKWTSSNYNEGQRIFIGDLDKGRKAYAEVYVYLEFMGSIIKVKGYAGSAFNWTSGSLIHHAAFALLQGGHLKFEPAYS